jgi:hypothetical protein
LSFGTLSRSALGDARQDCALLGGTRLIPSGDLIYSAQAAAALAGRRIDQTDADAGRWRRALGFAWNRRHSSRTLGRFEQIGEFGLDHLRLV